MITQRPRPHSVAPAGEPEPIGITAAHGLVTRWIDPGSALRAVRDDGFATSRTA
jgi:hypothetical protein